LKALEGGGTAPLRLEAGDLVFEADMGAATIVVGDVGSCGRLSESGGKSDVGFVTLSLMEATCVVIAPSGAKGLVKIGFSPALLSVPDLSGG
jgi:hypothetical protein